MSTRQVRRIGDESGFTLVELLVVMTLMLIVGGVVVNGIVSGLRASERGRARVEALTDLERAAERMARDLRFADPVDAASATQVIVNVLRDDAGVLVRHRVTFTVDAATGTITETRAIYDPPLSATPTSTTTREVIGDLDPAATVFAFGKADGQPWDPVPPDPDTLSDLAEIRLDLRRELPDQDPIEVETSVFVRNVGDGR
ncbi:MAG: type II secretion system GspH family protein [Actinobacteria bacterium]|nr:type II secretion system GspH family protein [Actinomycetota bacterium]